MDRKEAIELVRENCFPATFGRLKEAMLVLVPELAESEDEKIRKEIIDIVESYRSNCVYEGTHRFDECIAWLEKQKEQKPAEWSEDIIQKAVKEVGLTQHQIAWFKTNVFPSKQEWSEEDEKKIVFLERLIRYNFPEGQYGWVDGNKGGFVTKLEAISMLKSLRPQPQWKPTERMVNALKWAVSEFHPDCPETMEQLEYLYTELKSMYYGPIK